jgi:alkylhydroperoxidase family enzyme
MLNSLVRLVSNGIPHAPLFWRTRNDSAETHAPDEVYESVRAHFEGNELVDLTLMIAAMNAWNRMAIGFRRQPSRRDP